MTVAGTYQLTFPRNEARGLAGRKLTQAEPQGWRGIVRQYELSCVVQESLTRHGVRKKKKEAEEKRELNSWAGSIIYAHYYVQMFSLYCHYAV